METDQERSSPLLRVKVDLELSSTRIRVWATLVAILAVSPGILNDTMGEHWLVSPHMAGLKKDPRHNICAFVDVIDLCTAAFRDALNWINREVLEIEDERRNGIRVEIGDIKACLIGWDMRVTKEKSYHTLLSREWRCIAHIMIVCMPNRKGGFDQLNQQWVGAMKCLVMHEAFNFSYLIYSYMIGNTQQDSFLTYPRFVQMIFNAKLKNLPTNGAWLKLTYMSKRIFVNMQEGHTDFSGTYTRLFDQMYTLARLEEIQQEEDEGDQEQGEEGNV
ncbi:hypothetical protein L1987_14820 [Smallanthus sonchifolius]|uniref:Uncharacterized protein n=1 Tax=Smallanthus sonchifolius TaxID=185202 RepID=A0ACB9J655_9ASTR|nr:hypothetical protein L1987_14820 [Smallanthus sonchifolius]